MKDNEIIDLALRLLLSAYEGGIIPPRPLRDEIMECELNSVRIRELIERRKQNVKDD